MADNHSMGAAVPADRLVAQAKGPTLSDLEQQLGYRFRDNSLLTRALTHGSAVAESDGRATYQRLEFLGDRVLGLIIADLLWEHFPHADEGELARRFNALVRRETCMEVAKDLGLGAFLIIGASEERSGGRRKTAILADAAESVIGAIYRDGGFDAARELIAAHWQPRMLAAERPRRDAKTALQEWSQGRGMPPPTYEIIERKGPDHAPIFKVRVLISGLEPAFGEGRSRRDGEQIAASSLLVKLGLWDEQDTENGG